MENSPRRTFLRMNQVRRKKKLPKKCPEDCEHLN